MHEWFVWGLSLSSAFVPVGGALTKDSSEEVDRRGWFWNAHGWLPDAHEELLNLGGDKAAPSVWW